MRSHLTGSTLRHDQDFGALPAVSALLKVKQARKKKTCDYYIDLYEAYSIEVVYPVNRII